jgi:hypothetical protein
MDNDAPTPAPVQRLVGPLIRKVRGKRYINTAGIYRQADGIVILEIDMRLKRPDVIWHTSGAYQNGNNVPGVFPSIGFCASDDSFYNGRKIKKATGEVSFPAFFGWKIYSAERNGRYTISVVFLAPPNSAIGGLSPHNDKDHRPL